MPVYKSALSTLLNEARAHEHGDSQAYNVEMISLKFDIMENNFFIAFLIMYYIYLNASQYHNILFSFTLFSCLK